MAAGIHYALLSPQPLDAGFGRVRTSIQWVDGPLTLLESADSLSIRRAGAGDVLMRKIDLPEEFPERYHGALLLRFDLMSPESGALAWDILIALLLDDHSFDVWNGAYPARTIAKYAALRPLTLLAQDGYLMRSSEFEHLTERYIK